MFLPEGVLPPPPSLSLTTKSQGDQMSIDEISDELGYDVAACGWCGGDHDENQCDSE